MCVSETLTRDITRMLRKSKVLVFNILWRLSKDALLFVTRYVWIPEPFLTQTPFSSNPSLRDVAALLGLAAVLLGLCSSSSSSEGPWLLALAPWGLTLLGWVGLRGAALWRRGRMQRAVHSRATQLQALLHDSKTLTGLSRKALRLVQETEVISRGFTL